MKNIWQKLNKPILALAPMAGVADSAFRQICKGYGADLAYSEMASVAALAHNSEKTLALLAFAPAERPYLVQLFGAQPAEFALAARIVSQKLKPDGIDINFGCPVKKVQKQGAGAILMNDKKKAREIVKAVIHNTDLPVSIKVRAQAGKVDVLEFLDFMRDLEIKAVMIHGRTLAQGFSGEIDTRIIKKARSYFGGIIIANGGINSLPDAQKIMQETGADGLGIARGALGRPWIFQELKNNQSENKTKSAIFKIALQHARLAEKLKGRQGIIEMRKHLCWYVQGLQNASEIRRELIAVADFADIERILTI